MDALTRLAPMEPGQRPALRAAQPAVWMLQGPGRAQRGAARAFLRRLLADYLLTPPAEIRLDFAPGKAACVHARWQGMPLSISMSYSHDAALVALCPGARIGIDLTEIAAMPDWAQVARLYLGAEAASRLATGGGARERMFALAWAELEARGKCLGLGLQEWSPARHDRLHAHALQVSTGELAMGRSGKTHAFALARDSMM